MGTKVFIRLAFVKCSAGNYLIQSPLTSLRTYDVTHSRFLTHFRILKTLKVKILIFLLLHKLGLLYIFNWNYVFKC